MAAKSKSSVRKLKASSLPPMLLAIESLMALGAPPRVAALRMVRKISDKGKPKSEYEYEASYPLQCWREIRTRADAAFIAVLVQSVQNGS
eukprot:scaffold71540_cov33-Prasinocladus_malaysianus.AAC.1